MKVLISVVRKTTYTSIVEMQKEVFDSLKRQLEGGRSDVLAAFRDLNRRIDVKDWNDDDFEILQEFRPFIGEGDDEK